MNSPALPLFEDPSYPGSQLLNEVLNYPLCPGLAVDLGAGICRDSQKLLAHGWRVLAVDKNPIPPILSHIKPDIFNHPNLEYSVQFFEALSLPSCQLVWSNLSLPFCHPDYFHRCWASIHHALVPKGLLAATVLGENDSWSSYKPTMTFLSQQIIEDMLKDYHIIYLDKKTLQGYTHRKKLKTWDIISVMAQKL